MLQSMYPMIPKLPMHPQLHTETDVWFEFSCLNLSFLHSLWQVAISVPFPLHGIPTYFVPLQVRADRVWVPLPHVFEHVDQGPHTHCPSTMKLIFNQSLIYTIYRAEKKSLYLVWWSSSLLLLITPASACLKHSRNLVRRLFLSSVKLKRPLLFSKMLWSMKISLVEGIFDVVPTKFDAAAS